MNHQAKWLAGYRFDPCEQPQTAFIDADLLFEKFGPFPKMHQVAGILQESNAMIWRRIRAGELELLKSNGRPRITLKSLVAFINQS
jgi:hypothetical protein